MSTPAAIDPEYVAELERRLAATEAEIARVTAQNTVLETTNISLAEANARLERMLAQAKHEKFGPSSEKGNPDQRNLFTEDIEVAEGQLAAAADAADKALGKTSKRKKPAKRNKGNLPDHLERVEEVIEPESTSCPCGCGEMVKVGEDRTERLDVIPAQFRGKDPAARVAVRQKLSKPIVEALRPWLEAQLEMLPSSSDLARHIKYGLKRWQGLTRFLDDGRIEMDTNAVENAIRPIPLTRKNALFAGSDDGAVTWARMASLIGTCKLNDINPQHYLEHVLEKILGGHMQGDIKDLMPWNFKPDETRHS